MSISHEVQDRAAKIGVGFIPTLSKDKAKCNLAIEPYGDKPMSSTNDMLAGFMEMAEATRLRPELEAKIKQYELDLHMCDHDIADLNSKVDIQSNRIASLEASLAEAIKQRDDAMFRGLQMDERIAQARKFLASAIDVTREDGAAEVTLPVAPAPEPIVEQPKSGDDAGAVTQGQSEAHPTNSKPENSTDTQSNSFDQDEVNGNQSATDGVSGQSEPLPTETSTSTPTSDPTAAGSGTPSTNRPIDDIEEGWRSWRIPPQPSYG